MLHYVYFTYLWFLFLFPYVRISKFFFAVENDCGEFPLKWHKICASTGMRVENGFCKWEIGLATAAKYPLYPWLRLLHRVASADEYRLDIWAIRNSAWNPTNSPPFTQQVKIGIVCGIAIGYL